MSFESLSLPSCQERPWHFELLLFIEFVQRIVQDLLLLQFWKWTFAAFSPCYCSTNMSVTDDARVEIMLKQYFIFKDI
jgi:hypothetical protein